jgi:hypothetical protein
MRPATCQPCLAQTLPRILESAIVNQHDPHLGNCHHHQTRVWRAPQNNMPPRFLLLVLVLLLSLPSCLHCINAPLYKHRQWPVNADALCFVHTPPRQILASECIPRMPLPRARRLLETATVKTIALKSSTKVLNQYIYSSTHQHIAMARLAGMHKL